MKKNTVLITGGAGYIGTVLTEKLLQRQDVGRVICYDNLMYKQEGAFVFCSNPKYEFVHADVRDYETLDKYISEADIIIPLAAIVGFPACEKDKNLARDVNHLHIEHICGEAAYGTKIIYPNSNSGYGVGEADDFCTEETPLNPISTYGKTKCAAEKKVLESGGVAFRLATVFGTSYRFRRDLLVNDFVLRAVNDNFIVLFEHKFKRNFIHIRDVVNAFLHCIDNYEEMKGEAYNVGLSSANLSKMELCEKIKEVVPEFVIMTSEINSDPDKRDYIVSNEKLEATGWRPTHSLYDGFEELIKAYRIYKGANTKDTNL
jgi:nucleoside-diphosphate-sugar epimerase